MSLGSGLWNQLMTTAKTTAPSAGASAAGVGGPSGTVPDPLSVEGSQVRRALLALIAASCVLVISSTAPTEAQAEPIWDDVCRNYQGGYVHLTLCWYTTQVASWPHSDERTNEALALLSSTYGVKGHIRVRAIVIGYLRSPYIGFYEPVTQTAFVGAPRLDEWKGWSLFILVHELGHTILTQQGVLGTEQHCRMFNGPLWEPLAAQWIDWYESVYFYTPQKRAEFCN